MWPVFGSVTSSMTRLCTASWDEIHHRCKWTFSSFFLKPRVLSGSGTTASRCRCASSWLLLLVSVHWKSITLRRRCHFNCSALASRLTAAFLFFVQTPQTHSLRRPKELNWTFFLLDSHAAIFSLPSEHISIHINFFFTRLPPFLRYFSSALSICEFVVWSIALDSSTFCCC